ncbi:transposase [Streptomyces sp. NPDC005728]|uniref:transposase n=1 Tax=Streptomyces sp. NPDC005728 TaxID=3157054 RepID=UPI0033F92FFA
MRRKSPYPAEFRNDAVALYRAAGGKRTYAAVTVEVGVTGETLWSWVHQADKAAGRGHDQAHGESRDDEQLARLRAEIGRLRRAESSMPSPPRSSRRAADGSFLTPSGRHSRHPQHQWTDTRGN